MNTALNIVELAMEHLDEKVKEEIVKGWLRGQIREVARNRCQDDPEPLIMAVAEKLQRKMHGEAAAQYHETLLNHGIDARKPLFRPGQWKMDTIEDILRISHYYKRNDPRMVRR